ANFCSPLLVDLKAIENNIPNHDPWMLLDPLSRSFSNCGKASPNWLGEHWIPIVSVSVIYLSQAVRSSFLRVMSQENIDVVKLSAISRRDRAMMYRISIRVAGVPAMRVFCTPAQ